MREFEQRTKSPITLNSMRYWESLTQLAEKGGLDTQRLAKDGRNWIKNDPAPATTQSHLALPLQPRPDGSHVRRHHAG